MLCLTKRSGHHGVKGFSLAVLALKLKRCVSLFLVPQFLAVLLCPSMATAAYVEIEVVDFQKGMCYVTWEKDRFASTYSDQALERLRKIGVDHIQVNVTHYQETATSTEIMSTALTPSDKSIAHVIKTAHKLGLKIMLKPHIDLIDDEGGTYCRSDIGFQDEKDWDRWFDEYEKFITHYAKIAEKNKVESFCVGTELSFTAQKNDRWEKIISRVRSEYSGKLTYAANWDNYKNIKFWEKLDFVGIDAYFPLTNKSEPDLDDLKEGWKKWKDEIESWHSTVNKPIVFTEIGYSSSRNAPSEPWKNGNGNADTEMQAKCYTAFFETVWNSPWLAGVYWWQYAPTIHGGGENNPRFTPLNKPAEKVLEQNYRFARRKEQNFEKMENEMAQKAESMETKLKHRETGSYPMAEERKTAPMESRSE